VNYNLYVSYWTGSEGRERAVLTSTDDDALAIPQQNAGSATYRLALYDDDRARYNDDCSDGDHGYPTSRTSTFRTSTRTRNCTTSWRCDSSYGED